MHSAVSTYLQHARVLLLAVRAMATCLWYQQRASLAPPMMRQYCLEVFILCVCVWSAAAVCVLSGIVSEWDTHSYVQRMHVTACGLAQHLSCIPGGPNHTTFQHALAWCTAIHTSLSVWCFVFVLCGQNKLSIHPVIASIHIMFCTVCVCVGTCEVHASHVH